MSTYSVKEIVIILIGSMFLVCSIAYLNNLPEISSFFSINRLGLSLFGIMFILVAIISVKIYHSALDYNDEETFRSVKAATINIILWCCFWAAWAIYNATIFLTNKPLNLEIFLVSFILVCLPAVLLFVLTWSMRKSTIKNYPQLKRENGIKTVFSGMYKSLSFRYFSGFYSILTIPFYILLVILGLLLRES